MRLLMVGPWRTGRHAAAHRLGRGKRDRSMCRRFPRLPTRSSCRRVFISPACCLGEPRRSISQGTRKNGGARAPDCCASASRHRMRPFNRIWSTRTCSISIPNCASRAGLQPLVVSAWGYLNGLLTKGPTAKDKRWMRRLRHGADTLLVENPNLLDVLATLSGPPLRRRLLPDRS